MGAQRQPVRTIVLDYLTAFGHWRQFDSGFVNLGLDALLTPVGLGKEGERVRTKRLDRPGGFAAADVQRPEGVGFGKAHQSTRMQGGASRKLGNARVRPVPARINQFCSKAVDPF